MITTDGPPKGYFYACTGRGPDKYHLVKAGDYYEINALCGVQLYIKSKTDSEGWSRNVCDKCMKKSRQN